MSTPGGTAITNTAATPMQVTPIPTLAIPTEDGALGNFVEFAPRLYRGEQPDEAAMKQLKDLGIKTVINLRTSNYDEKFMKGLGMRYVRIPINAFITSDEQIVAFLRVATDEDFLPAFAHCLHGSDRTGMMVAAYRICIQKWDHKRAIDELGNFGFHTIYSNIRRRIEKLDSATIMNAVLNAPTPPYLLP